MEPRLPSGCPHVLSQLLASHLSRSNNRLNVVLLGSGTRTNSSAPIPESSQPSAHLPYQADLFRI